MDQSKRDLRSELIDAAVYTVAQFGLDGTTTKRIADKAVCNEVYIYRNFANKDDLLRQIFALEDVCLADAMEKCYRGFAGKEMTFEQRAKAVWHELWRLGTSSLNEALFYLRFYYSANLSSEILENHDITLSPVVEHLTGAFVCPEMGKTLVKHAFETALSCFAQIARKELGSDEEAENRIFSILYSTVSPWLKDAYKDGKAFLLR